MNTYQQIESKIIAAKNIVITSHKSPDGDSVGSSLGLLRFVEKLGKKANISHADLAPEFLFWLDVSPILLMTDHLFSILNVPKKHILTGFRVYFINDTVSFTIL